MNEPITPPYNKKRKELQMIFFGISGILFFIFILVGGVLACFNMKTGSLFIELVWVLFSSMCTLGSLKVASNYMEQKGKTFSINTGEK